MDGGDWIEQNVEEMKNIVLVIIVAFLLTGCRGQKELIREVPVYVHDTTELVREVHDSTYVDRWHTELVKGDTVRIADSVTVVRWMLRTDTAYIRDEVTVPVEMVREVAKPLTRMQLFQIRGFWVLMLLMVGVLFVKISRILEKK